MRSPHALRLAAAASAFAFGVAGGQQARRPLPFDSTVVQSLLAEALRAATEAAAAERPALVNGVGLAQVQGRDFAGAERTLSLGEQATSAEVARQLGESLLFTELDRANLATKLVCALRDAGRGGEALDVVRRMRPGEEREWQLARAAAFLARAPLNPADSAARRRGEPPRQWRDALAIANEVALPEAKLDALIAVMRTAADSTVRRDMAVEAFGAAKRVRLNDADRQASRNAMLAAIAIGLDRLGEARALVRDLSNAEDLYAVLSSAMAGRKSAFALDLAPRVVDAGRAIADPAARYAFLSRLWTSLERYVGRSAADDLLPDRLVGTPSEPAISYEIAVATSNDPHDVADRAGQRADFAAARRAVERLPVLDRQARRAFLWSQLAWGSYSMYRDTAAAFLKLARESLIASHADSATWD
ncbi:MAG: hypothetical protein ACRDMZ_05190, partial [Solirubrobacteraceae bacterium]